MTVKIDFEVEREGRVFRDAIVLTEAEVATLSEADIEAMKDERFAAWLAIVTAPPPAEEPADGE